MITRAYYRDSFTDVFIYLFINLTRDIREALPQKYVTGGRGQNDYPSFDTPSLTFFFPIIFLQVKDQLFFFLINPGVTSLSHKA